MYPKCFAGDGFWLDVVCPQLSSRSLSY